MNFLSLLTAIITLLSISTAYAAPSSYEILDGPTAPEASAATITPPPTAAASVVTPEETEAGVAYDIVSRKPPRINSTGITPQSILNAQHGYVRDTPVKSYVSLLLPPDGDEQECQSPTKTGITVYRQVVRGIWEYNDAFCINQGCVYMGTASGSMECE